MDEDQEVQQLEERMAQMRQDFELHDQEILQKFADYAKWQEGQIQFYRREFQAYRNEFGNRPLSIEERKKVEQMWEWMKTHANTDGDAD
jgi:hypothetical protein